MLSLAPPHGAGPFRIVWASDEPDCESDTDCAPMRVADAGLAIDAVAHGLGSARVPALLAQTDVAAGRVLAHGAAEPHPFGYWLVAPTPQWRQKKVRDLVAALLAG